MLGIWSVYKTMSFFDLAIAGLIASACAFIGEGAQLIFGNLSDRGHRKRLIMIGIVLASANGLLAFTQHYTALFCLFLMTCIGSGAFHPAAVAMISGLTEKWKGLYIAIFACGGAFGMASSQIIFAKTHSYFEGNTLPLLIPSGILFILLLAFRYYQKEDLNTQDTQRSAIGLKMIGEYFKDKNLSMLYITQVCNQIIFWGTIFLLPDVLITRGYDEKIAYGGGHMAFIIGSAFMMIPSGYFADRYSHRKVILYSSFFAMILFYIFLFMPELSSLNLILILLVAGAFLGVVQPIAVALGNELGKKNPGMASAFTMGLVWCVSETIGPVGTGLMSKLFVEDAPAKSLMAFGVLFPIMLYTAYQLPVVSVMQDAEIKTAN